MPPVIHEEKCNGCALCDRYCPLDVIHMEGLLPQVRYPEECWHCGVCRQVCPKEAVSIVFSPTMLAV